LAAGFACIELINLYICEPVIPQPGLMSRTAAGIMERFGERKEIEGVHMMIMSSTK
jgi:hypothetical protein